MNMDKAATEKEFLKVFRVLKSELLQDPAFEFAENSRQWVDMMLDHHVLRGKGKRSKGMNVVESFRFLKEGQEISEDDIFLASVLGWCVEWLHAYFVALKDITGKHKPSCFTVPKDATVGANDGLFLRNHIPRILKRHFKEKPYYIELIELFNEVEFRTCSGLMLDFISAREGENDISIYSMPLYRRIVKYKTSYHSFYISAACAFLMSGENLEDNVDVTNILVNMGIYFQAKDDFLDCYGDTPTFSKQTRADDDIEELKCSWLVVTALEKCNEEQKKTLSDYYDKDNTADSAKVKAIYDELNLQVSFVEYEAEIYKNLMASIESLSSKAVQALLKSFLYKIHTRLK